MKVVKPHLKKIKKNDLTTKMKLCTTSEYMNNGMSFEKKEKNNLTTGVNLYTNDEF